MSNLKLINTHKLPISKKEVYQYSLFTQGHKYIKFMNRNSDP